MKVRIGVWVLLAALALPAAAQRDERVHTTRHTSSHGNREVDVRTSGEVTFTEDADWVASVAPGASLQVHERTDRSDRRMEFRADGRGGVEARYWEGGRLQPATDADRAWARRILRDVVREGSLGAESRVRQIRARQGVSGVLREVGTLRTDTGRRLYLLALLRGEPLNAGEFEQAMAEVPRRIESSTEARLVLTAAAEHASDARRLAAVLGATSGLRSDLEKRLVLTRALNRRTLNDGPAMEAFYRAADSMESDLERRLVLSAALRDGASEAAVVGALRSAAGMRSDLEKRLVLSRVPASRLRRPAVSQAYHAVLRTMRSDQERAIALRRLAAEQ